MGDSGGGSCGGSGVSRAALGTRQRNLRGRAVGQDCGYDTWGYHVSEPGGGGGNYGEWVATRHLEHSRGWTTGCTTWELC